MAKFKVKVSDVTNEGLERTKQIQINKAKAIYQARPFVTRVYVALKTGIDIEFLKRNWEEITS